MHGLGRWSGDNLVPGVGDGHLAPRFFQRAAHCASCPSFLCACLEKALCVNVHKGTDDAFLYPVRVLRNAT